MGRGRTDHLQPRKLRDYVLIVSRGFCSVSMARVSYPLGADHCVVVDPCLLIANVVEKT
jgi:hypothetical protein